MNKGIFNVLLGNGLPDAYATPGPLYAGLAEVFAAHPEAWLQVEILDKTRIPLQWETMSPRQRLVSVAYSLHSQTAVAANDVPGKDISPNSVRIPNYWLVINRMASGSEIPQILVGPQGAARRQGRNRTTGQVGPQSAQEVNGAAGGPRGDRVERRPGDPRADRAER